MGWKKADQWRLNVFWRWPPSVGFWMLNPSGLGMNCNTLTRRSRNQTGKAMMPEWALNY
jgi:hypothetical protein